MVSATPDGLIFHHLAVGGPATVGEIAETHAMDPDLVAECLSTLEGQGLVAGRQYADSRPPRRVYSVRNEGRRKTGIGDARTQ